MKRFVSVVLLIGLLLQVFSKQLALVEYDLNKKFISNVLCVKKDIPGNNCQGKCHLKKELSKDDEEQRSRDAKSKFISETVWLPGTELKLSFFTGNPRKENYPVFIARAGKITGEVFHPPGMQV